MMAGTKGRPYSTQVRERALELYAERGLTKASELTGVCTTTIGAWARKHGVSIVKHGYTGREAADLVGCSYRQVDYWARTGVVEPTVPASGSGTFRGYSDQDIDRLRVVTGLVKAGFDVNRLRDVPHERRKRLLDAVEAIL